MSANPAATAASWPELLRSIRHPRRWIRRSLQRRRFLASVRATDSFVVSYPKSGTTWVSFFLASILADRGRGTREPLSLLQHYEWLPGINRGFGRVPLSRFPTRAQPRFFRVHAEYDPALPRVLYLVRDPRDVMVSYYYHRMRLDGAFDLELDAFIEANAARPGDWGGHVRGWLDHLDPDRHMLVRYEDLRTDPEAAFGAIARFCGLSGSAEDVRYYIELSSFGRMRQSEQDAGVTTSRDVPFVRRGKVEGWRDELTERSIRHIESRYGELMAQLGYAPRFPSTNGSRL